MTNQERIAANATKGYILVKEFDGWEIVKKQNEAGGWTYYSNQIGHEGYYIMWDTAVQGAEELIAIIIDLKDEMESLQKRETELWKAFGNFCQAINAREANDNNTEP